MKLEIKGLTKKFGSFTANDHIDLTIEPGEIHCLLGENGAGKSTLMNMLYGLLDPTEGEILVDGEPVTFSVAERRDRGRDRHGAPALHAGPGVHGRRERHARPRADLRVRGSCPGRKAPAMVTRAVRALRPRGRPGARWSRPCRSASSSGSRSSRRSSNEAKVLILDEPTAVLTPQEIDELMDIMRSLKEQGTSIIFITHKLREVKAVGDRISVIRRGKVVGTAPPSTSEAELAEMMVGREVKLKVDKDPPKTGRGGDVRRGLHGRRPAGPPGRQGRLLRGARRRGARHRGGPGQRPDRADQGAAGAGQARRRRDPPRRRRHQQARPAREPRRRHRLHPRGPLPRRLRRRVQRPREPRSSTSTAATSSPAASCSSSTRSRRTPTHGSRSSTSAPSRPRHRSRRSPAATSRRSWWPGSSRGRSRC